MAEYTDTQLLEILLGHFSPDERGRRLEWIWQEGIALHEKEEDPEAAQALYERCLGLQK